MIVLVQNTIVFFLTSFSVILFVSSSETLRNRAAAILIISA